MCYRPNWSQAYTIYGGFSFPNYLNHVNVEQYLYYVCVGFCIHLCIFYTAVFTKTMWYEFPRSVLDFSFFTNSALCFSWLDHSEVVLHGRTDVNNNRFIVGRGLSFAGQIWRMAALPTDRFGCVVVSILTWLEHGTTTETTMHILAFLYAILRLLSLWPVNQ